MPNVDDHGLEVLKKAARNIGAQPKQDYALQVWVVSPSDGSDMVSTVPEVSTLSLVTAGTQYSFSLPTNCKGFLIKARTLCRLKINYAPFTTDYVSIGVGGYFEDDNFYTSQDLYIEADKNNIVLEIVTYK